MSEPRPEIVLVHGLWMHGCVFALHRRRLHELGWRSHAYSYRSLCGELTGVADGLAAFIAGLGARPLNVIAHSLGGCVALDMLARHRPPGLGRIVLLGSPVLGSGSAQQILRVPVLRHGLGRVLPQWLARAMPDVDPALDIGVIAGNRPIGLGRIVPGMEKPNDGMVAVRETRWPGARDHIVLPVTHMQMLWSRACLAQALRFLDAGAFDHGSGTA
ncbi:alpha/beta fold hydrolase [Thauera sp.]|jgi:pimeloyl-ACP methyl ester carboxylesterase|uniref:alpha/beta fold hydrolase n=1 Tax=Thauera sp. TaxID=1905334 RepID=UPI002A3606D9|nr:alpha/beta fold hydrolase [Thauera sp.]MDX9884680.1 alpha/beta fold hydrolase [Thauera sp.]